MRFKDIQRKMSRSPLFIIGASLMMFLTVACVFCPLYVKWDPVKINLAEMFIPPDYFANGLSGHPFGTDSLGRDIFTRVLYGGRISLYIAVLCCALTVLFFTFMGLLSGYFGGWVDRVIMRACDVFMSVPQLMLAVCIIAMLGSSVGILIITLSISSWSNGARIVRANTMAMKNMEFISASRLMGASSLRIMFHDIFPNVLTPIIIDATCRFGSIILSEANLSYLGMGVQIPTASWGNMISEGRNYLSTEPWVVIVPGIMLMLAVLGFNFVGDGIRDILDPKNKN